MSTQSPSDPSHQLPSSGPRTTSSKEIVINFTSPQFRSKVAKVLSETANGCLQGLDCQEGAERRLSELQSLTSKFQDENRRLFDDNRRLALMVKEVQGKLHSFERFHEKRVQSMEQQIATLHKGNQEGLTRERRLAAGFPEDAQLHADYTRLQVAYAHLKQQMLALQRYVQEQPHLVPNQPVIQAPHPQMQVPAVEGGQPPSAQEAWKKDLQPPFQGQISQPQQKNAAPLRPRITIPNGPAFPSAQPQPNQSGNPKTNTPIQNISQANHILTQHKVPAPPSASTRPSPPSSSHSPSISSPIYAQRFKTPGQPVIQGWSNDNVSPWSASPLEAIPFNYVHTPTRILPQYLGPASSAQVLQTLVYSQHRHQPQRLHHPQSQLPPRSLQVSPSSQHHPLQQHPRSTFTSASASPINPGQISSGIGPHQPINASAGVPILPPPKGIPVAPIGPPGKFLPPLVGAFVKPGSPTSIPRSGYTSRPTPTSPSGSRHGTSQTSTPTPSANPTGSTTLDPKNTNPELREPPVKVVPDVPRFSAAVPEHCSMDITHTPHLTPSSSRASIGLSEGVPEAVTPRDTPVNHFVGVVGSPAIDGGQDMNVISPSEGTVALSTLAKRPSVYMDKSEDVEVPLASLTRKRPRLDEDTGVPFVKEVLPTGAATTHVAFKETVTGDMTVDSPAVDAISDTRDEDDKDVDEEDEFGPDGTRSIKYCLEMFTDEDDNGIATCLLCSARHEIGLINQPANFAPDTPQEERVQHFANEHPTAWEDLLHGRNA